MASERLPECRRRRVHVVLRYAHAPRRAARGLQAALRDVHDIGDERRVTVFAPPGKVRDLEVAGQHPSAFSITRPNLVIAVPLGIDEQQLVAWVERLLDRPRARWAVAQVREARDNRRPRRRSRDEEHRGPNRDSLFHMDDRYRRRLSNRYAGVMWRSPGYYHFTLP